MVIDLSGENVLTTYTLTALHFLMFGQGSFDAENKMNLFTTSVSKKNYDNLAKCRIELFDTSFIYDLKPNRLTVSVKGFKTGKTIGFRVSVDDTHTTRDYKITIARKPHKENGLPFSVGGNFEGGYYKEYEYDKIQLEGDTE